MPLNTNALNAAQTRVHLDHLDGLRAIAALYIVSYHILGYHTPQLAPRLQHLLAPLMIGHGAVAVFIVLSGFCLMLPVARGGDVLKGGAITFFRRRARRILPTYYAALALSLLLDLTLIGHRTGTPWDQSVPVTRWGLLAHLFMLQDAFYNTWAQINSPLWSIAVEWRIYFCFPLLVWAWRRFGPWRASGATILLSYALTLAFSAVPLLTRFDAQVNGITPQYLGLFALGMLGAGVAFSPAPILAALRVRVPWNAALLLGAVAVALAYGKWHGAGPFFLWARDVLVGLVAVTILVAASVRPGVLAAVLSWRPLVWIGTYAYSLYLIHFPLVQLVWQYALKGRHRTSLLGLLLHWLLGMALSVGGAYLFFLAFERPYLTTHRRETPAEVGRDAAISPAP